MRFQHYIYVNVPSLEWFTWSTRHSSICLCMATRIDKCIFSISDMWVVPLFNNSALQIETLLNDSLHLRVTILLCNQSQQVHLQHYRHVNVSSTELFTSFTCCSFASACATRIITDLYVNVATMEWLNLFTSCSFAGTFATRIDKCIFSITDMWMFPLFNGKLHLFVEALPAKNT